MINLKNQDLYAVLKNETGAQEYFNKLPDYVRDQISTRAGDINSFKSLKDYAENLTRGDG